MSMHWVLLANEAKARVFTAGALLDELEEVDSLIHPPGRLRSGDLKSDRPGRFARGDGSRTTADPQTDTETVEAERFARTVAEALLTGHHARAYERLVILAAPRFLGHLRAVLDPGVARVVVAEIAKDFTERPAHELPAILHRVLPPDAGMPAP